MVAGRLKTLQTSGGLRDCDQLIGSDARRGDLASDVGHDISVHIKLINRKGPSVTVPAAGKHDLFPDIGGPNQICPGAIPAPSKVMESVGGPSGGPPNPHTEIAGDGRPPRIHYFRSVAMPGSVTIIDHSAVWGDKLD